MVYEYGVDRDPFFSGKPSSPIMSLHVLQNHVGLYSSRDLKNTNGKLCHITAMLRKEFNENYGPDRTYRRWILKIVKPGRAQKGWTGTFKCTGAGNGDGGCGAELLVSEGDVYSTASHARDETTNYKTFRCVSCGVETDLDEKKGYGCTPKGKRLAKQEDIDAYIAGKQPMSPTDPSLPYAERGPEWYAVNDKEDEHG